MNSLAEGMPESIKKYDNQYVSKVISAQPAFDAEKLGANLKKLISGKGIDGEVHVDGENICVGFNGHTNDTTLLKETLNREVFSKIKAQHIPGVVLAK